MTADTELTNKDVVEVIEQLRATMQGDMRAMEARLTRQIRAAKDELSSEIAEAYDLNERRIARLERVLPPAAE